MNPRDFLGVANSLLAGSTEAAWRSAVSRSYYAVFHATRVLFRDLGFQTPRADQAHAYLWLRLSNCGDAHLQIAGQRLKDLRGERNRADYDIDVVMLRANAATHVREADQLILLLDAGRVEPVRTQIRSAMRTYERTVLGVVTWQGP
jgi:uncharacterized protein (UPF0332 family)